MIKVEQIRKNIEKAAEKISVAALAAGRDPGDVSIVVVTKGQPAEMITAVHAAGAKIIGENYPNESVGKIEDLEGLPEIQWHMIGHLQTRKARLVASNFDMFHALDSLRLAQKLDRALGEVGRKMPVLLQFNVSGEDSKGGWPAWLQSQWREVLPEVENILELANLEVKGLMTMPPLDTDIEQVRPYFSHLRALRNYLADCFPGISFADLSMGTSADYGVAVEEGATFVRLGTTLIGPRPQP
jgi:PLP dependent protein